MTKSVNKIIIIILLAAIFTAVSLILFLPVMTLPKRFLYGFPGDPFWVTWYIRWFHDCQVTGLDWTKVPSIAFPFGLDFSTSPHYPVINQITTILTSLFNEIAAYNAVVFISFPLSGLTMYLLAKKVTGNTYASFFAGVLYAFCPYHAAHSLQHLTLSNIQWLPLFVYSLIRLDEKKNFAALLFCAVSSALIFFTDFYYVYFAVFLTAVFFLVRIFSPGGVRGAVKLAVSLAIAAVMALLIIVPVDFQMLKGVFDFTKKGAVDQQFQRTVGDLLAFSAKPLDYLVPPKYNPLFGRFVPDFGLSPVKGHRLTEHTLYLGVIPIILSIFAIIFAVRRKNKLDSKKSFIAYFALALVAAAGLVSLPPVIPLGSFTFDPATREIIAAHKIYMPSYFMHKIVPFFRCYARFGLLVTLGTALLSAIGFGIICDKIKRNTIKFFLTAAFSSVLFLEFLNLPSVMAVDSQAVPPEYLWLKGEKGDFAVAEYPLGDKNDPAVQEYVFYQRLHGKKIVNGAVPGTEAYKFHEDVNDIKKEETVDALGKAGVRYILVHTDKYKNGDRYVLLDWITAPPRDKIFSQSYMDGEVPFPAAGSELVKEFDGTFVYKIKGGD